MLFSETHPFENYQSGKMKNKRDKEVRDSMSKRKGEIKKRIERRQDERIQSE